MWFIKTTSTRGHTCALCYWSSCILLTRDESFLFLWISVDPEILGAGADGREMNLIYVSQDNVYEIPECISKPISRFELPPDSVQLRQMIGRGAFGRVYAGEAYGINGNPELTAVAIKTLKG